MTLRRFSFIRKMPNVNGHRENGNHEWENEGEENDTQLGRPPAIEEDLWAMGRRKRVKEVLGADDFRSELEQCIHQDFAKSFPEDLNCSSGIGMASNMLLPHSMTMMTMASPLPALNVNQILHTPPIPIADLARSGPQYSPDERKCRNKLATIYRLVDLFQWSQGIYNHITLRLPSPGPPQILINPFGLLYHEVTASSLIKLTLAGDILDQGSTNLGVNQAAYVLHSAIHEARPDVHCIVHLHTAVVAAIGSMKCGLLPICQEAMIIGPVAYHDYQGILTDEEEKKSIVRDLGDKNVMILRNHGFVACGQTVEDALHLTFHTIIACETQILILRDYSSFICCGGSAEEISWTTNNLVMACHNQIRAARAGIDNLIVPNEEAVQKAYLTARRGGGGVNRTQQNQPGNGTTSTTTEWGIGELEWEAWCRVMDKAGFCTGHTYRNQQLHRQLPTKSHHSMYNLASSVATPPNGPSSYGAIDETEGMAAWRLSMLRKERERAKWLNSPCQYQKVQLTETGGGTINNPRRMVTKWIEQIGCASDSSGGTPVKIHSPHQFSPCNGPAGGRNEFKERQRKLKEARMQGRISPGPKSQILQGIPQQEEEDDSDKMTRNVNGNNRPVYIGTASRGIIQRDQQINAQVYGQLYAPNPFKGESDNDLKEYLREIERNNKREEAPLPPPTLTRNGNAINSLPGTPIKTPESPTTDTASLMQAVTRVKLNGKNGRSASGDDGDEAAAVEKTNGNGLIGNGNGKKGKDKTKAKEKEQMENGGKEKKKKRRGLFFFGRKKSC